MTKKDRALKPDGKIREADPGQSARFIEAARELGCEDHLDRFDEAVRAIGKARRLPEREPADKDRQKGKELK